ncbi:MAG: 6-phosphofructokinase [Myxococcales bacterium]|nr:6-phosphofructokinase [Myxococcales bacterium]
MDRVGVLTGGGDCPGLNAVIRAIVRRCVQHKFEVVGVLEGWKGVIEQNVRSIDLREVSGILPRGGTILKTSRTNPLKDEASYKKTLEGFKDLGLRALIAIGGEDTLGVANTLNDKHGLPIIGVPKTIDNDLSGTDFTFGFDTAVQIATEAIDRLHTTAESHNRVMVVEVMGRHAGWIALYSGLAGGADYILIPEKSVSLDDVSESLRSRHERGKDFSIVVVSEGFQLTEDDKQVVIVQTEERDQFGHVRLGGIGQIVAQEVERRTGYEARVTVLGHIQRGGTPTAHDRILATRYGIFAVDMVKAEQYGKMAALHGNDIVAVDLSEGVRHLKTVTDDLYDLAHVFFG